MSSATGIVIERLDTEPLSLPELRVFRSVEREDPRGSVAPAFSKLQFDELGIDFTVVHENYCVSPKRGTVRGFHYQTPPHGQAKLIQLVKGRMLDVNIDIRPNSPTFGAVVAQELSSTGWQQIYVPIGFAHCYATLEDDTHVIFKLGSAFAPGHAGGFSWNDPAIGVDWGLSDDEVTVLDRDLNRPSFAQFLRSHEGVK